MLDTQIVVVIAQRGGIETLPERVKAVLEDSENELQLSVTSIIEIAIKHAHKKLDFSQEELELVCAQAGLAILPLHKRYAIHLYALPLHHKDPFDRMIIATALVENIPVLTGDREFNKYKGLKVIW